MGHVVRQCPLFHARCVHACMPLRAVLLSAYCAADTTEQCRVALIRRRSCRSQGRQTELPEPIGTNRHAPNPKTHAWLPFFEKCK